VARSIRERRLLAKSLGQRGRIAAGKQLTIRKLAMNERGIALAFLSREGAKNTPNHCMDEQL
jgi:hypothetical protein